MKQVFDPNGNELFPTLVQITERNADGLPTKCVIGYPNDSFDIDGVPTSAVIADGTVSILKKSDNSRYLLLWAPRKEIAAGDLASKMHQIELDLASTAEKLMATRKDALVAIDENKRITAELEQKTAALRELQKERDPDHVERLVQQRTEALEKKLNDQKLSYTTQIQTHMSTIEELKASKKKLREALERAKEGKK